MVQSVSVHLDNHISKVVSMDNDEFSFDMQNNFHVSLHFPHGFTKAHIKEPTHPSQLSATLVFPKLSGCSEDNPTHTNLDKDI
jgi:hypothetical protein